MPHNDTSVKTATPNKSLQATRDGRFLRRRGYGGRASSVPQCGTDDVIRPACLSSRRDRKSTRLNSSHLGISYAVFCLKKINKKQRAAGTTFFVWGNFNQMCTATC